MTDVLVKPAFVALQADSGDTAKLGPTAWNAARLFSAGAQGDFLMRDTVSATGAAWSASPTFAGTMTTSVDGIGTTSTDGSVLQNATPATAGVPVQQPPRFRLRGHAWNSTTPATNTDDWWIESVPGNGATPTGVLKIMSSLNGAAAVAILTLNTAFGSTVTAASSFVAGGNFTAGAAGLVRWTGRGSMSSPADSQINLTNAAASIGVGVDVGVDAVLKIRTRAQSAYATLDCLGLKASGAAGVSFGPAHPASITIVNGIVTACS